jgi:hypothetical protein
LLSPPSQGLANRFDSIGFSTSDAEAMRQVLAANGIPAPKAVEVAPDGSRSFLTRDQEGNLDLYAPDGTRAEFMEFKTVKEPCCASFTGTQPEPSPTW